MFAYIIGLDCVSQDICKETPDYYTSTRVKDGVDLLNMDNISLTVCQLIPMELSLEHSLHFWTMLALPRPPFSGTLSCGNV